MMESWGFSWFLIRITLSCFVVEAIIKLPENETFNATRLNDSCKLSLDSRSINYFHHLLEIEDPNIIYFRIAFKGIQPGHTMEAFHPKSWVWTYSSTNRKFPYLYWRYDYETFSFGLLSSKTLTRKPYMVFTTSGSCNLTLGTQKTTKLIAEQFKDLIHSLETGFTKYHTNYWCYMAEVPEVRHSSGYYSRLYFGYPAAFMKYNCCHTFYNFTAEQYVSYCPDKQVAQWPQTSELPYVLGILLFLYSPIVVFEIAEFISKNEKIRLQRTSESDGNTDSLSSLIIVNYTNDLLEPNEDRDWIFLDGSLPKSCTDLFRSLFCRNNSVALSRMRRLLFVLLVPFTIYLKLIVYRRYWYRMVNDALHRGVPFGFLSLLSNTTHGQMTCFVPALGGPITMVVTYFAFGIVVIVFPKSFKQVIQNSLPQSTQEYSPLNFGTKQISHLSQIGMKDVPGYKNASNLLQCSFFMLFSTSFWKKVLTIQILRYRNSPFQSNIFSRRISVCFLPFYIILCVFEILLCFLYYIVPMVGFIGILVRGCKYCFADKIRNGGRLATYLFKNKVFFAVSNVLLIAAMTFYLYSVCLVFIESFFFLFQFLVYSYLAVIMYPASSFGYLFTAVILVYYIFHLIGGFGRSYLELLNDTVEITLNLVNDDNHVTNYDGHLVLTNVKISQVKSIRINGELHTLARNTIPGGQNLNTDMQPRITFRNNAYGIPKDLFEYITRRHMPVHKQILKLIFQLILITMLLVITISLTAGFKTGLNSQLSDVMHVVFIVTIGALPRVLEVALSDSSEHIARDIRLRRLEETLNKYWKEKEGIEINGSI